MTTLITRTDFEILYEAQPLKRETLDVLDSYYGIPLSDELQSLQTTTQKIQEWMSVLKAVDNKKVDLEKTIAADRFSGIFQCVLGAIGVAGTIALIATCVFIPLCATVGTVLLVFALLMGSVSSLRAGINLWETASNRPKNLTDIMDKINDLVLQFPISEAPAEAQKEIVAMQKTLNENFKKIARPEGQSQSTSETGSTQSLENTFRTKLIRSAVRSAVFDLGRFETTLNQLQALQEQLRLQPASQEQLQQPAVAS